MIYFGVAFFLTGTHTYVLLDPDK